MRSLAIICVSLCASGCRPDQYTRQWDTTVSLRYEGHPDSSDKVNAEISFQSHAKPCQQDQAKTEKQSHVDSVQSPESKLSL
jgi:hypothetical protein